MTEYSNEEIVDSFLDHVRHLKVAHHVNGRIRVKASWNGAKKLADVEEGEIEKVIANIPGIEEYRVNKKALSVIITYDPEVLPYGLWQEIGTLGVYPLNRNRVREQLLTVLKKQ